MVAGVISMAIVFFPGVILAAIFKVVGSVIHEADTKRQAAATASTLNSLAVQTALANTSGLTVSRGALHLARPAPPASNPAAAVPVVSPAAVAAGEVSAREQLVGRLAESRHLRNTFLAVPYVVAFLGFALAAYYLLLFGLFFENERSLTWLRACAVSIVVGGLVLDPLMLLLKVSFCVVVCNEKPKRLKAGDGTTNSTTNAAATAATTAAGDAVGSERVRASV